MKLLVTGGSGFIGSAVVRRAVADGHAVINLDAMTYAANAANVATVEGHADYTFEHADIRDASALRTVFERHDPDAVMHLAAESHVDRSIDGPGAFIDTNVMGTYTLLEAARRHWQGMHGARKDVFRFHHVSTDEVYGDLGIDDAAFTETTPYDPSSPYSASKAASDHLVRAWGRTYGLPVVLSNCSNNYGPFQFPEKLVPVVILKALHGLAIPVYGRGDNIRDWLHVEDHADALLTVLQRGTLGRTYNVGGNNERSNLELVEQLCAILDRLSPSGCTGHRELITFVPDRPGHDRRYAVDASRIRDELGWQPRYAANDGFEHTVQWYLDNESWWRPLVDADMFGVRLGHGQSPA